ESVLLLELAREISDTDDQDKFCFQALRHVVSIVNAEKCSLFWMRDSAKGDSKELASRLWNITPKSTFDDVVCDSKNELVVPVGVGIAGLVAETKEAVIVSNVYEHPNFNKTIDEKTGFESRDLLCQPLVLKREDKVVGVVEVVNKKNKEPFTTEDAQVLEHFLVLCNLAIQNCRGAAQITRLQQAATVSFLWQVNILFVGLSYYRIRFHKEVVMQISDLIQCERYTLAIALIDNCNIEGCLQFAKSYDLLLQKPKASMFDDEDQPIVKTVEVNNIAGYIFIYKKKQQSITNGIADVLRFLSMHSTLTAANCTKTLLNDICFIFMFEECKLLDDAKKEFSLKSALCVAFYDGTDRLLGVLHLGNKKKKGFDENDEAVIQSVRPYIMNGLLFANGFNSIVINKAKTDVAEDTVRFHIRPWQDEVDRVVVSLAVYGNRKWSLIIMDAAFFSQNEPIPEGEKYNLYQFTFSDLLMSDDETVMGAMRMFLDLDAFNLFHIRQETMLRWLITTRRCYRPVYYHNWRHGLNVAHTMFLLLDRMTPGIDKAFNDREKFALVVACFCHDIDHRGTNNAFLIRAGAPLAILYNTSTLENHHYDTCLRISSIDGNNIFESFTKEQFESACELMKHAILATDLALYFQRRNTFKKLLEKPFEERDFVQNNDNRMLLMSMMMTACDLSSITKPWEVQQKMAKLVTSEFYDQGDQERALFGTEPMPMMDRRKIDDLPKMQIGFIDGVCSMAYEMMADFCPGYAPLRDGMRANRQSWKDLASE
uniref:Phosphodiesterase n=1 Tax=Ciona intestinalis TaxID=7719 RepID=H2XQX1_CIOIN